MAEVLITYKAESDSLIAVVKEVVKGNVAIGESATKAGQDASKAYKDAANSAKAAFGSQETSKQLAKLGSESKKVILEIKSTFENVKTSAANTAVSLKEQVTNLNASRAAAVKNNKEAVESIKVVNTYTNAKQEEAQAEKKSAEAKKKSAEETKKNIEATRSLSSELKISKDQLTLLASEGKKNTSEYRELAKSTASLQKSLLTTNKEIKLLSSGSEVFSAAIGAVKGLAAGFAVVQGAAGLFAKDNEELQNAIAKTNSAMAILTGLQEVNNILTGGSAKNLGVLTIAQKGYNFVVGQSTGAMKVFKIALASTGVGLLVVALGYLISSLSDTSEKTKEAADEARDLQKAFNELGRGAQDAFDELNNAKIDLKVQKGGITKFAGERIKTITDTAAEIRNIEQKLADDETAILEEFNEKYKFGTEGREEAFKIASARIKKLNETSQNEIEAVEIKRKTAILKIADDENKEKEEKLKKAAEARKKAEEDAKNAREKLLQLELDIFSSSLDEQGKVLDDSNKEILALEATFREAKFKKGSAEEIEQQKKLQNSIEEIKKQATAKNIELEKQSQEKILAAKLEAAKAGDNATLQVILASLETQQKLELESAETLNKSKLEITTRYGLLIANVNKQIAEANVNTQVNNLKRLEIVEGTSLQRRIQLIEIEGAKRKLAAGSIADDKERASAIELINAETQQAITKENKTENQKRFDEVLKYAEAVGSTLTALNDLQKQLAENRIADINSEKEAQLAAINESSDTERSKIRQREALELRTQRKIAEEKTKQAKADKALALFNIALSTAQAVAAGLSLVVGAPAFIAFAIALGAIQAATVLARPIPKFAQGGVVGGQLHSQGGTQIEAEKDEYIVKRSQSVKHRKELDAINTSTQAFRNMINERYVRPAIMNYVLNRKQEQGVTVNASLNSKAMESELRGLRKDIRNSRVRSINTQLDSRYTWQ
jgi:hypothetical protein